MFKIWGTKTKDPITKNDLVAVYNGEKEFVGTIKEYTRKRIVLRVTRYPSDPALVMTEENLHFDAENVTMRKVRI